MLEEQIDHNVLYVLASLVAAEGAALIWVIKQKKNGAPKAGDTSDEVWVRRFNEHFGKVNNLLGVVERQLHDFLLVRDRDLRGVVDGINEMKSLLEQVAGELEELVESFKEFSRK